MSIMEGQNGVRMTYGNLLTTLVLAGSLATWVFNVAGATEANASDIEHEKELREQQEQFLNEKLKRIEKLLEKLAEE